jgi:hypothetical protein
MGRNVLKLCFCLCSGSFLSSCGSPGIPVPPSLELPKPVSDLRAMRKGSRVYLGWTVPTRTTERQTVRYLGPTRICRVLNKPIGDCRNPIAELAPHSQLSQRRKSPPQKSDLQASYVDVLPQQLQSNNPDAQVTYAVAVLNESGRSAGLSNEVKVPAAPTLPPPANLNAEVTAQGVRLFWLCDSQIPNNLAGIQHRIRIYRKTQDDRNDVRIGEADLNCETSSMLDQNIEWEKSYEYRATPVTVLTIAPDKNQREIEGDDTPTIRVFAHDAFPPTVPAGLQAVASGPGEPPSVDLVWRPDTDADLAGYNVYRNEEGGPSSKLNSELVKTSAFRNQNVQPGRTYHYSVTAVDLRGNESELSEEAIETVP